MQTTIKELDATKVEMTVTLPATRVDEQVARKLRELGSKAQIKGFRPGKVPAALLKSMLGERALGEALNDLMNITYPQALAQQALRPLDQGSIEKMEHEPGGEFSYVAVVEVAPRVQAVNYKGVEVKRPVRVLTAEDTDKALEQLRHDYAAWEPLEDGNAAEGDQLFCDIQETDEAGVDLPNRLYKGIRVELGKGQYGPDFDVKMQGATLGESRFFDVVNADDDPDPSVAGKTEWYRVQLHEIKRPQMQELNDDFAKDIPPGFETLDELKAQVEKDLQSQLDRSLEQAVGQLIISAVMERNPVEVPEKMIAQQLDGIIEQARRGTDNPIDDEIVRRSYHDEVSRNLAWSLVSQSIIKAEGLALTEEEQDAEVALIAARSGQDPKKARVTLRRLGQLDRIFGEVQERKLIAFLREHATVSDEESAA